jgi:hypothetical protein
LVVAGSASLVLLAWIGFVPGSIPFILRSSAGHPVRILITALFALLILLALAPVLGRGPARMRWLALLLCIFPALALGVAGLCLCLWML